MTWVIVGLGNPGEEYKGTRHSVGRMALEQFAKDNEFSTWKEDKRTVATVSKGAVGKNLGALVLPDTFMNKSGAAVSKYVKSLKAAERMIVVYDDLDLPLGTIKVSFNRGSGGHKGLESVTRAIKTKEFARVRIGISPKSAAGKIKKPQGEEDVAEFILARFKESEQSDLKKVLKEASKAITTIITDGYMVAMNHFN
ncbi:MAG TPA: aminoacyl-tRNA hydrolase [Candidatus Paceibacterota bacterium]|nr:aminoacyl-tRNA hydrolase [Candidatus Paceibacterota bacterium]